MRRILRILSIFIMLILFLSPLETSVNARHSKNLINENDIHLLSSTSEGITFEVQLSLDEIIEETVSINGKEYIELSIPGWSKIASEGEPKLPKITETVGVPFGVDIEVQVEPGRKYSRVLSHPVLPEGTQSIDWEGILLNVEDMQRLEPSYKIIENREVYDGDKSFPGLLAEITGDGVIRNQRVVGVSNYPFQYNPGTGELILYESLIVTVKFSGLRSTPSQSRNSVSAVYEDLLENLLLNYDSALGWREEPPSLTLDSMNRSAPWTPPDPGWRVKVREDGFYELDYDQLDSAGLPVDTLNPQTFQLFHLGSEVAIHVEGEGDGIFNSSDTILFYGQGIDSKYTVDNVYWLTYGDTTEGLRMGIRDVTPGFAEIPPSYLENKHMEVNNFYRSTAPGDETLDRWMWDYILTVDPNHENWSHSFILQNPHPGEAKFDIMLLGSLRNSINPDHHVEVYLQNSLGTNLIGEAMWDGITWNLLEIVVEPGSLQVGENTIIIVCPADTGVGYDFIYIDWVNLDYFSSFTAVDDQLAFLYEESGPWKYKVEGFTTNDVMVFDMTDPTSVEKLTGGVVESVESEYTLQFEDTITAPKKFWTMTEAETLTVHDIEQDLPSNILASSNGAEHLIITHEDFFTQADTLRLHREDHGMVSMVVDIQDVYNVFNFGIVDVQAIRDFLVYTIENWDPYPSYVLLFGDGHYNPNGYNLTFYNTWHESYIPPYLAPVDPDILETAADNRYVTLVGEDLLPDMMLGRLAVNNTEEANAVVNKIMTYENTPPPGDWRQQILAVTDNPDNAGNFYLISDNLLDCCLPEPFTAEKVYFKNTHLTEDDARAAIQDGINAGKLIVNYIGHASTSQWAGEALFKLSDIADLSNGDRMPIMLAMTCMDGYYINPGSTQGGVYPSIAETIIRVSDKGAIASWSPTGWGNVSGHDVLNRGFFETVFKSGDGMLTLGAATQAGKIDLFSTGTNQDLMDTYLLFGDPATRIVFDFTEKFYLPLILSGAD